MNVIICWRIHQRRGLSSIHFRLARYLVSAGVLGGAMVAQGFSLGTFVEVRHFQQGVDPHGRCSDWFSRKSWRRRHL